MKLILVFDAHVKKTRDLKIFISFVRTSFV
jgi:hypothetical protein